jgi:predicted nucleic acid-binding protein
VNAFDADVLIYAVQAGQPWASRVRALFPADSEATVGMGSLILMPEVLSRPKRRQEHEEVRELTWLLSRLELLPLDLPTADLSVALAVMYGLKAADAVHLATAVNAGADRFVTNNQRDFPKTISEIEIAYPEDLQVA